MVSDSVEEMEDTCAHLGIEARFHQLEPGPLHVDIACRRLSRAWITRRHSSLALDTVMQLPPGCAGIGILTGSSRGMHVRGASVSVGDVIVVRPGAQFELTSPRAAEFVALDLPAETLQRICDSLGVRSPLEMSGDLEVHRLTEEARRTALLLADDALRLRGAASGSGATADALREQESLLLARVCASIAEGRRDGARARSSNSGRAFVRARKYIDEHLGEPICLEDLCTAAGVSLRTLQSTFRAHTGVSPMAYLRLRRLNAARRLLLQGDPRETSVTEIALSCGLPHLARFAGYYRRHFGMKPSEALRLSSA